MKLQILGEIQGSRARIGTLETAAGSGEQFSYEESFLSEYPQGFLSISLPARPEPFSARQTKAYFENLLPEGGALLAVAKKLETKSTSYLKILEALGTECIGAVMVCSDESCSMAEGRYRAVSREELICASREGAEGVASLQVDSKLSLAGAQSKTGLFVSAAPEGGFEYALPLGSAASTHIVKTSNRRFEALSENEYFCLKLAALCRIAVPNVAIDVLAEDCPLFIIERFDRKVREADAGKAFPKVVRIHQEDLCQAMGKSFQRKYEKSGQGYVGQIGSLISEFSNSPVEDLNRFIAISVFNALVGNCDAHPKNYSLLHGEGWDTCRLAPAYDVASTVVYQGLDRHLAMRIGRCSKIDELTRDDFVGLASDLRMSKTAVLRTLDEQREIIHEKAGELAHACREELALKSTKLEEIVSFANNQIRRLGK